MYPTIKTRTIYNDGNKYMVELIEKVFNTDKFFICVEIYNLYLVAYFQDS